MPNPKNAHLKLIRAEPESFGSEKQDRSPEGLSALLGNCDPAEWSWGICQLAEQVFRRLNPDSQEKPASEDIDVLWKFAILLGSLAETDAHPADESARFIASLEFKIRKQLSFRPADVSLPAMCDMAYRCWASQPRQSLQADPAPCSVALWEINSLARFAAWLGKQIKPLPKASKPRFNFENKRQA